jgi:hypothetical protein
MSPLASLPLGRVEWVAMGMLTSIPIDELRQRGSIRDGDVARLRRAFEEAPAITAGDAEALFALHAATPVQDPTWSSFFVEAITDYIVNQAAPEGYVVAENTLWLREQISTFGRIETSTELSLLVHVLETARWTPPSLAAFALDQIRHAVETGGGPLRAGRAIPTGTITTEEVELAARIIRAFGADTNIAVTRAEADALIAINRALMPGKSSPAWSTLFVRTVGSAVLAAIGHAVEPRRELIDGLASAEGGFGLADLFLGEESAAKPEVTGALRVWRTARIQTGEERALARLERQRLEIVTNEAIDEASDAWLIARLLESLPHDGNEAAILAFVMREAGRPTPELAQFAARQSIAA